LQYFPGDGAKSVEIRLCKTDTHRQSELVALLCKRSNAINPNLAVETAANSSRVFKP